MPAKENDARKSARDESRKLVRGFEERLERLEKLADALREGKIPLEEAIALFEEGMKLARSLEKDLSRVERRVEILTNDSGDPADAPSFALFPELSQEEENLS
jgi:exodeoxyribonuclease VII small subunit